MAIINDATITTQNASVDAFGSQKTTLASNTGAFATGTLGDQPTNIGGVTMFGKADEMLLPVRADRFGGLSSALFTPLFADSFEGATIHSIRWNITNTTMAATQSTVAGVTFNSGAITTATTGYMLQSTNKFLKILRFPLHGKFRARIAHVVNSVFELGFADAATFNGTNTTGAYFQVTSAGVLQPVLTFNSVDITGTSITYDITKYYTFDIFIDDDDVLFTVQDSSTGLIINRQSIKLPLTAQRILSSTAISTQIRLYNTATPPATASQVFLTNTMILGLDILQNKTWPAALSGFHRGSINNPFTGAQLTQWSNSAEPTSATLSNTTAGYTTLGGKFQFATVAGAATDYALFAFQVPSPSNLVITGITIDAWNTGAAVATTPTLLTWGVATGSTAASLATATVNRLGLGSQSFPVGAAVGANVTQINKSFITPLYVPSGRFVHIILRMPVGSATATQVVAGLVNIEGYFE